MASWSASNVQVTRANLLVVLTSQFIPSFALLLVHLGVHRAMGVHVSKVRSVELDQSIWTDSLIEVHLCLVYVLIQFFIPTA